MTQLEIALDALEGARQSLADGHTWMAGEYIRRGLKKIADCAPQAMSSCETCRWHERHWEAATQQAKELSAERDDLRRTLARVREALCDVARGQG